MAFGAFRRSMRARSFPFLFLPLRLSGGGGQTASASSRIRPYSASNLCLSGDRVLAPCHRPPLRPLHVHQGGLEARRPSMAGAELLDARQLPEQVRAADGVPRAVRISSMASSSRALPRPGSRAALRSPHALLAPPGADRLAGELLCGRAVPQAVFPFTSVPVSSKWTTPLFRQHGLCRGKGAAGLGGAPGDHGGDGSRGKPHAHQAPRERVDAAGADCAIGAEQAGKHADGIPMLHMGADVRGKFRGGRLPAKGEGVRRSASAPPPSRPCLSP